MRELQREVSRLRAENAALRSSRAAAADEGRAEEEARRLTRTLRALSHSSHAMVRATDEQSYLEEVCRIIVEDCGRSMVWIGFAKDDPDKTVEPVAHAGFEKGYLDTLRITWADTERGRGPTGTAIRTGKPCGCSDIETDYRLAPWRDAARERGYASSIVFPLMADGRAFGAVSLYAREPDAFSSEHERRLLAELVDDLAYGITSLRLRAARERAEDALRESERRHRSLAEALREADIRKNEFLAVLSHELRNPLAPIRNGLHILAHAAAGSEEARRARAVIERQVTQICRLIDDLLDLTRISRGKILLRREPLELNELVLRVAEDHQSVFARAGLRLEVAPRARALPLEADAARLSQVIGNLLQNAAKFTPRGGRAEVVVEEDEARGQAIVRVRDSGVGMTGETLSRLFVPFMQADTTLDRSQGGLGLGLSLVKSIVELHGGEVSAASEGPCKGAELTVRLPLATRIVAFEAAAPASGTRLGGMGGARRILIIEDNIDAAETLREVLSFDAHTVEVAHDGCEGLALARAFEPDIVLCDIGLPGMDGYEVARAFRADARLRSTRLVALSGYALPDDVARAKQAGFDAHLAKPPKVAEIERLLLEDAS